jgi:hypothetical protein
MKSGLIAAVVLVAVVSSCFGDLTPDEIARTIIQSEHYAAYNPVDRSTDELAKADAINAELRLRRLILESNNEELIFCYALSIVNRRLRDFEAHLSDSEPKMNIRPADAIKGLKAQRALLVKYLNDMNKTDKPNKASDATSEPAPSAASSSHQR